MTPSGREAPSHPAAALLRSVHEKLDGDLTTLGTVLAHLGERAPGFLLLALAIPAVVPTPGVPAGMVFGTVLALVALQMIAGRDRLYLPGWLRHRPVRRTVVVAALRHVAPLLERIERRLAPRYRSLTGRTMVRPLGAVVLVMGVLIALPIPFGNTLPGLAVLVIALGLIAHDGLAVAVGIGLSGIACVTSAALIAAGWWMLSSAPV